MSEETKETPKADCCSAEKREACCEPEEKAGCCGGSTCRC